MEDFLSRFHPTRRVQIDVLKAISRRSIFFSGWFDCGGGGGGSNLKRSDDNLFSRIRPSDEICY